MAEQEQEKEVAVEQVEEDDNPDYKAPAPKALDEILNQDAEDASLNKYKETLLGGGSPGDIIDPTNPNRVIIQKLSLIVTGRDEMFIDLTKPAEEIKKQSFVLKCGCHYNIKIYFFVQRDIVTGLKYEHRVYKVGFPIVPISKMSQMIGSFAPNKELKHYSTKVEEAPSGTLTRGNYKIKSRFVDDDKHEYANWEWHLTFKKEWEPEK